MRPALRATATAALGAALVVLPAGAAHAAEPPAPEALTYVAYITSGAGVREQPDPAQYPVCLLPNGAVVLTDGVPVSDDYLWVAPLEGVELTTECAGWSAVAVDAALEPLPGELAAALDAGSDVELVEGDGLLGGTPPTVWAHPTTLSERIADLDSGAVVRTASDDRSDGFAPVRIADGRTGWVKAEHLGVAETPVDTTNETPGAADTPHDTAAPAQRWELTGWLATYPALVGIWAAGVALILGTPTLLRRRAATPWAGEAGDDPQQDSVGDADTNGGFERDYGDFVDEADDAPRTRRAR